MRYITSEQSEWRSSNESTNNKCWSRHGEQRTFLYYGWWYKLIQPLWRTVCRVLKKLKTELPYDPAILPLAIYLEKVTIQKDTCLEKEMASHSSILVWETPWTEEPDRLQSMGEEDLDTTWQLNNNNR